MKITGSYKAFQEWMAHEPLLTHSPILIQVTLDKKYVTDILVEGIWWVFRISERPTEAEFRRWAITAIAVDSWTI